MPLVGRSGPPQPVVSPEVITPPVRQSNEERLDQQRFVKDSFINRTAFNPTTYAEEFKLLQRYSAGSRIRVTYFLLSNPPSSLQRSEAIDPSSVRNPIQTSYTEINEFELVFQDKGLQSSFNGDSRETKVTGVALIYPGMVPHMGDLFVTPMGDGMFGLFQVMDVERLTYRQGSNHKISFFLREFASVETLAQIRQSVTRTVWFDVETYLGDATTLLKADSYRYLTTLRQMRSELIRYYYTTFYDKQMSSIVSPDGVYDPYLVAYLTGKISILDSIQRPTQLYPGLQNYDSCLWSRLTDLSNRRLVGLQATCDLVKLHVSRWDVAITSLTNRVMVCLANPDRQDMAKLPQVSNPQGPRPSSINRYLEYYATLEPVTLAQPYVLSAAFYAGDKVTMTPFEFLVYAVIRDRCLTEPREFIDGYLNRYAELSYEQQYYYIPLYLWLIDVAITRIAAPDSFMT